MTVTALRPENDDIEPDIYVEGPSASIIEWSATIGRLAGALAAAQLNFEQFRASSAADIPGKDGKRGYKYKYGDLAALFDAARPFLNAQGIAVLQGPMTDSSGKKVTIETVLAHKSGEWARNRFTMTSGDDRPQAVGSVITYARRYAAQSMLGIASEEDDDGKTGSDRNAPHDAGPTEEELLLQRSIDFTRKRIEKHKITAQQVTEMVSELTGESITDFTALNLEGLRNLNQLIIHRFVKTGETADANASPETSETPSDGQSDVGVDYQAPAAAESTESGTSGTSADGDRDAMIKWVEEKMAAMGAKDDEDDVTQIVADISLDAGSVTYVWRNLSTPLIREFWKRLFAARKAASPASTNA